MIEAQDVERLREAFQTSAWENVQEFKELLAVLKDQAQLEPHNGTQNAIGILNAGMGIHQLVMMLEISAKLDKQIELMTRVDQHLSTLVVRSKVGTL